MIDPIINDLFDPLVIKWQQLKKKLEEDGLFVKGVIELNERHKGYWSVRGCLIGSVEVTDNVGSRKGYINIGYKNKKPFAAIEIPFDNGRKLRYYQSKVYRKTGNMIDWLMQRRGK